MGLFACLFVSPSWSDGRIGRKDSICGDVIKCIDYMFGRSGEIAPTVLSFVK